MKGRMPFLNAILTLHLLHLLLYYLYIFFIAPSGLLKNSYAEKNTKSRP